MRKIKRHSIDQSQFYKLRSFKKLAKILNTSPEALSNLLSKGDDNYYESSVSMGKGKRNIQVPLPQLRRLHNRIQVLLSRIIKPEYLYSSVKKLSNVDNCANHKDNNFLCKADLAAYYQSTSSTRVFKAFVNIFKMEADIAKVITRLCTFKEYVPTGSPISHDVAFYANLNVFNQVDTFCKKRGVSFSLYVDDLTFSSKTVINRKFMDRIIQIFKKNTDYEIHKIRHYGKDKAKPVTGAVLIDNKLVVPLKQKKLIHNKIDYKNYLLNLKPQDETKLMKTYQSLIGLVSSASQISPKYSILTKQLVQERRTNNIPAMNQNNS